MITIRHRREIAVGRNEARRWRGYGFKGKRVRLSSAFYDDKSLTLLAACNVDGFVAGACQCQVTDETVDSVAYAAWVEDRLCPCLGDYREREDTRARARAREREKERESERDRVCWCSDPSLPPQRETA